MLLLYLPGIFIVTHISVPGWVQESGVSDKALHFLMYMILVFLMWFSVSPNARINWRKPAVWVVFFAAVLYAASDEWLQGFVGRFATVADFFANFCGVVAGLLIFSFFSFWPASVIVTGITIFALSNCTRVNLSDLIPVTNASFHLLAYAFLTAIWIRCVSLFILLRAPNLKWLTVALAPPVGFLAVVKLYSLICGKALTLTDIAISLGAIIGVVATVWLAALLRSDVPIDRAIRS